MSDSTKTASLSSRIDWSRPELVALAASAEPLTAFTQHLRESRRGRYLVELERRAAVLEFLRGHYPGWRDFDTSHAARIAGLSLEQAKGARALRELPALGRAWLATGDPAWGTAFERFFLGTATGDLFNWGAFIGTQPAHELDAWLLLRDCPGFTPAGQVAYWDHTVRIAEAAWDGATSQWHQASLGPEGHNWYLHGVHGLVAFGALFPEFTRSDFLMRCAHSVMEEHMRGHYRADGGARETTLAYQSGSLRILWELYVLATRNGWTFYAGYADTLLQATRFLLDLMTPDGSPASVGDGGPAPGAYCSLAAVAAAVSGDPTCKWYAERVRPHSTDAANPAGVLPQSAFWEVGLEGAAAYARVRARAPRLCSVLKGDTGYAAMRSDWGADTRYMHIAAADRGPIVTSHGHNDIFALEVFAGGERFLGEMGCAPYGDSPGRLYDQTTAAHNCLCIDGQEQADIVQEWRWTRAAIPCVRRWISEASHSFFHGTHEGFYHWPEQPLLHARKVLQFHGAPGYWLVFDWLEMVHLRRDVSVWWHGTVPGEIAPGHAIRLRGQATDLHIAPPTGDALALSQEQSDGLSAYIAEKKLDAARYPCFRHRQNVGSHCFVWLIAATPSGGAPPRLERLPLSLNGADASPALATAVRVTQRDQVDEIILNHREWDADLSSGDLSGWGTLLIRRRGQVDLDIRHTVVDGCVGR